MYFLAATFLATHPWIIGKAACKFAGLQTLFSFFLRNPDIILRMLMNKKYRQMSPGNIFGTSGNYRIESSSKTW